MIDVLQGSLGSGKSAAATAMAMMHIRKGGVVAANFSLVDGWSDEMAKRHIFSYLSDNFRYKTSSSYWQRFFRVGDLEAIRKINPRELSTGVYSNKESYSEGHGLLIIDEAHLFMNARKWQNNEQWIQFFTQSRKIGWNVVLIAHTIEMIDSHIRVLCEYESRFRNLQKVKFPILGFPLSPIPLFLVIRRYAGLGAGASMVADRDLFPLPLWAARLYDSLEIFSANNDIGCGDPLLCGPPPTPSLTAEGPKIRKSSIAPDCLNYLWDISKGSRPVV